MKNHLASRRTLSFAVLSGVVVAIGFVGIRTTTNFLRGPSEASGAHEANSAPMSQAESADVARLQEYARSKGVDEPASKPAPGEPLPDVNTMIDRLAARLGSAPQDVKGWQMLGWSYFHTERYKDAADAWGRAAALDPNSAELKSSYEEAKARAAGTFKSATSSPSRAELDGKSRHEASVESASKSEEKSQRDVDPAIRSMVDGLAGRLENSPRDVEGWTRLMRSRVVLGEKEGAIAALRKALEIFKDDTTATGNIAAAAQDLGLKVE